MKLFNILFFLYSLSETIDFLSFILMKNYILHCVRVGFSFQLKVKIARVGGTFVGEI